jgi:copper chaperone CopZ
MKKIALTILSIFILSTSLFADCKEASIKGMHCGSCASKVETQIKKLPEVKSVKVNVKTGIAEITLNEGASLTEEQVNAAVKTAGFTLTGLTDQK